MLKRKVAIAAGVAVIAAGSGGVLLASNAEAAPMPGASCSPRGAVTQTSTGSLICAPTATSNTYRWRSIVAAPGPRGPRGYTGVSGPTGATGLRGPQGLLGPKGDKGDKGDTGPQGLQGPKGDKGDTGPQGLKGDKGDTGVSGPTGATGPQGPQGPKGDKGDKGDAGASFGGIKTKFVAGEWAPISGKQTVSVTCDDGQTAIGGGFSFGDQAEEVSKNVQVVGSFPITNGWQVEGFYGGTGKPVVKAWAVCAVPAPPTA